LIINVFLVLVFCVFRLIFFFFSIFSFLGGGGGIGEN
jgi:hypothetical protein